jgi:hypothetical protein
MGVGRCGWVGVRCGGVELIYLFEMGLVFIY